MPGRLLRFSAYAWGRMKIAYFDCPSGAAGDMIMASLVDAGVDVAALRAELARLPPLGREPTARGVRKGACRATTVDVVVHREAHRHPRSLRDSLVILARRTLAPSVER